MGGCPFAFTVTLLYGSIGDAIALTATAPLERLVVLRQTSSTSSLTSGTDNIVTTVHDIIASGGYSSLWKGNTYSILHLIMSKSLSTYIKRYLSTNYMYLFDTTTTTNKKGGGDEKKIERQEDNDKEQQQSRRILVDTKIGLTANCISLAVLYPVQLAITNIIWGRGVGTIEDCLVSKVNKDGFKSMYSGLILAILGTINYQTIYMQLYNQFVINKKKQPQPQEDEKDDTVSPSKTLWIKSPLLRRFVIDQCITCVSCYFAYPYETICRRLQIGGDVSTNTYYSGIELRLLKTLLMNSILFLYDTSQYDIIRKVFMKLFH
jgi:hypothetical protein